MPHDFIYSLDEKSFYFCSVLQSTIVLELNQFQLSSRYYGVVAYLLTDRFDHMLWISSASSIFSCVMGTYLSYHLDISTGGSIVVTLSLIFVVTMFFAPKYGVLAKKIVKPDMPESIS